MGGCSRAGFRRCAGPPDRRALPGAVLP